MKKIELGELLNIAEYERVREAMRSSIIALKKDRRVSVGPNLTFLFENRATVLFQIQEMMRTERIVEEGRIQEEVDSYNALLPGPHELSATMFIEIPELVRMGPDEVRRTVNRFQGLDREGVDLVVGKRALPARFEAGHSQEEKMAAVHYLRFGVPDERQGVLADPEVRVRLVVDHPNYRAEATIPGEVRRQLLTDLSS
jgi:hypothetical protein